MLRSTGVRKNHKKGIARAHKERLRKEAEQRQAEYSKLPLDEKIARAGAKQKRKLLALKEAQKQAVK